MSIDNLPMLAYMDVAAYRRATYREKDNDPIILNIDLPTKNPINRNVFWENNIVYTHNIEDPILLVCPSYRSYYGENSRNSRYCYVPLLAYCRNSIPKNVFKWKNSAKYLPTMQIQYLLDEDGNPLWKDPAKLWHEERNMRIAMDQLDPAGNIVR